jgi:hypothetical protein
MLSYRLGGPSGRVSEDEPVDELQRVLLLYAHEKIGSFPLAPVYLGGSYLGLGGLTGSGYLGCGLLGDGGNCAARPAT